MRLGGPVFGAETQDPGALVALHRRLGYSAAYCPQVQDAVRRQELQAAFREADIVLAELGAFCLNISHPDAAQQERNIQEIIRRLALAEEMGARCCVMHGGSCNGSGCVRAHPDNLTRRNIEHNVAVIQRIIDEVQPRSTKLVLETESRVLPDGPELYLEIIQAVDRPQFAAHLDPVNITLSPRRFYFSGDFIRRCFSVLGPHLVSCHAKDTNLVDHATAQLTETWTGNGGLDYGAYLSELSRLPQEPPLMLEHLGAAELPRALAYVFAKADALGLSFRGAEHREPPAAGGVPAPAALWQEP